MNEKRKYKAIAALLTLLIMGGVVALLMLCSLSYEWPPKDMKDKLAIDQDSIMFGGEYVMLGDFPDLTSDDASSAEQSQSENVNDPNTEGEDLEDRGEPSPTPAPKPIVTAKTESPMKVKTPDPKKPVAKPAPATSNKPDAKTVDNKRNNQASNTNTDKNTGGAGNKVSNAFGKNKGNSSGKAGSPNGNSTTGNFSGRPGINGLDGYTLAHWGTAHSKWTGTIQVRVRVNARGKVIEAHATGGSGEAWQHPEVRRSCEQGSLNSAFSVLKSRTTEGVGTITWRFTN